VGGHINEWRGLRRFSFDGVGDVRLEWQLICLGGDVLKLHRWERSRQTAREREELTLRSSVASGSTVFA